MVESDVTPSANRGKLINLRRLGVLALAVIGALALLATGREQASATSYCPARAALPARVVIDRPQVLFSAPIVTSCNNYTIAAYLYGAGGSLDYLWWDATKSSNTVQFNTLVQAPGSYRTRLDSGYSDGFVNGVAWTPTSVTLKYASYDYVASTRVGKVVYINGLLRSYSNGFRPIVAGTGRVQYLQRYVRGGWQTVLARTANSAGRFAVGFIQPNVFQYRLVSLDTPTAWGAISASTVR